MSFPSRVCAPLLVASAALLASCAPVTEAPARYRATVRTDAGAVVAFADAQVGKRYCWGGSGPDCFDCSGLVRRAWEAGGVELPHSSEAIAGALEPVSPADARPGDVLWWPGHVAIYAGGGWAIEALDARDGVVRRRAKAPRRVYRPGGG